MSLFNLFKKKPIYCIYYEYNIDKGKKQGRGNLFTEGEFNTQEELDDVLEKIKDHTKKERFATNVDVVIVNICKL